MVQRACSSLHLPASNEDGSVQCHGAPAPITNHAEAVSVKRSLATRELALGLEGLHRLVEGEPLYRVHECVFGVLALESEPVDPLAMRGVARLVGRVTHDFDATKAIFDFLAERAT